MTIEVRRIRDGELREFIETLSAGFLERPDIDKLTDEIRPLWDLDRTWAAFEDGRMCGTYRSWATELTVPGGQRLPAAAVSAVTVLPTHRRRGILRAMVEAEHAAIRERAEAFGLLYAAEYAIYGRFGYGPALREATLSLRTRQTGFHAAASGRIEIVNADAEAVAALKGVFEQWRVRQPGEIRRRDHAGSTTSPSANWRGGRRGRDSSPSIATSRTPSTGMRAITPTTNGSSANRGSPSPSTSFMPSTMPRTPRSGGSSPRWIGRRRSRRSAASRRERLPWLLTNARALDVSDVGDGMWLRLMDVPRALGARTYEREGSIVLEVVDRRLPADERGSSSRPGRRVPPARETDRPAELTLDVVGPRRRVPRRDRRSDDAAAASRRRRASAGALADADALFRTLDEPWCSTFF